MKKANSREIYRIDDFPIFLTYEDIDQAYIEFGNDFVEVRAPFGQAKEEILNILKEKKETIRRTIKKNEYWNRTSTLPSGFNGEDLESARIFGNDYPIVFTDVKSADLINGQLLVPEIVKNYPAQYTEEFLDLYLESILVPLVEEKINYWADLIGVFFNKVRIRKTKSQWGSYSAKTKNISLIHVLRQCLKNLLLQ